MATPTIQIQLLGGLSAHCGDRIVRSFETRKAAELLAFLALHPGKSHSRDFLAELLWPDEDPDATRVRLRQALSAIRRALEVDTALAGDRASVCLDEAVVTTDLQEIDRLRRDAAERPTGDREARLQRIVDLYSGDLVPVVDASWATSERQRYADIFQESIANLAELAVSRRDYPLAIDLTRRALKQDPLRESAHVLFMRSYAAMGRSTEALRQYGELERLLRDELGADPSPETRRLCNQIRAGEIAAAPGPFVVPAVPAQAAILPRLPAPFTRFFGREEEVAFVCSALQPAAASPGRRLLTITGVGGTGKTSLALEAARRLLDPYAGRVWLVPLGDVEDSARILDSVHDALDLPRSDRTDTRSEIARTLGAAPSLLLLDNLEHLGEPGARVVAELMDLVPTVICLVTSRQRLEIRGERDLPLGPLPVPRESLPPEKLLDFPAVQLFIDRVQALRPRFALTVENASAIADVCRSLEGLPLAIDLVAAWAATLTPAQMRDRLRDGQGSSFDFLVSRSKETDLRHRSLRAALEGSLDQLPPGLQSFFCRLSVFHGSFTLEAAENVAGSAGVDTLSAIAELQARSLLREDDASVHPDPTEQMRFRVLGPVRAFAAERLAGDTRAAEVEEAHARYFFELVQETRGLVQSNDVQCLNRLDAELENLRAALNWGRAHDPSATLLVADAMCRFFQLRGHSREWRPWLDSLLEERRPELSDRVLAAALHAQASLAYAQSDFVTARASFEMVIDTLRRLGETDELIRALRSAGLVVRQMRDYEATRLLMEEALSLAQESGDARTRLLLELDLAYAYFGLGDVEAAERLAEHSLVGFRALGDRFGIATALNMLSTIMWPQGRWDDCRRVLEESIEIARADEHQWLLGAGLHGLGDDARMHGDPVRAHRYYLEAVEAFRRRDSAVGLIYVVESWVALAIQQNDPERAARLAGAAVARRAETGSPLPPIEREELDAAILAARTSLGERSFQSAYDAGSLLTVHQAVDLGSKL